MSEENKENGFNHVKTFTKIIFIFSVLVFNDNEYKITVPPSIYLSRFK